MRLDGGGGGGGGSVEKKAAEGSSPARRNRRRQKTAPQRAAPPAIQRLFDACSEVFHRERVGAAPSLEDVDRIRSVLDSMKLTDVKLTKNLPYFGNIRVANGVKPVTYLPVYEGNDFSIAIFCLPPEAVIPLHNHPGMTVFSKILFGTMHIKSYDWVDVFQKPTEDMKTTDEACPPGARLAKVNTNGVFTAPCSTSVLYPASGGNMHRFTALTACAVLDVLGPPYCDPEGRHCAYYSDIPYSRFPGEGNIGKAVVNDGNYAWLEEREKPEDFIVLGGKYMGPKIETIDPLISR